MRTIIQYIYQFGITSEHSTIDLARSRIINIAAFFLFIGGIISLINSLIANDMDSSITNILLSIGALISIVFCKKGKHQIAALIIFNFIMLLVLDLGQSGEVYFISVVIYLTAVPISYFLLLKNSKLRIIPLIICTSLFNYYNYQWGSQMSIFLNYNLIVFTIYIYVFQVF